MIAPLLLLLLAGPARLEHADVRPQPASGGLSAAFRAIASRQQAPAWIGWAVPTSEEHHNCCYGSIEAISESPCAGYCYLENDYRNVTIVRSNGSDCVQRGGAAGLVVLMRVEAGKVGKLRTFSSDCRLDAGGLTVFWFNDVRPADSVAFLEGFVNDPDLERRKNKEKHRENGEPALGAIALHDDPSADSVVERFAAAGQPAAMRKQAAFWLGNARGERGYQFLKQMVKSEPDEDVRRHLTFALSQSKAPEAIETMIAMARNDASPGVRGQALFWLAQKAGRKAVGTIEDAIRDDPETEVKTRAVFALTQLPNDEGIPELIRVARSHRNPEVRRKALFWLGQSKDPRALDFIVEVLK